MIDVALGFVTEQLNAHLMGRLGGRERLAVLSPLLSAGSSPIPANNKLAITVVRIGHEHPLRSGVTPTHDGMRPSVPPAPLNIEMLVSANFSADQYQDGLRLLSEAMTYFHQNPVLHRDRVEGMPEGLNKLGFEPMTLAAGERHALWTALGARYRPSTLYQLRGVSLADGSDVPSVPNVEAL